MVSLSDIVRSRKGTVAFKPVPHYSRSGDCLTFYLKDERCYAERIDDFLTVYRSYADNQDLVGCQIKGLVSTLELLGEFGLTIKGDSIKLSMIFLTCMAHSKVEEAKQFYIELGKAAKDAEIQPCNLLQAA